ncbi:MAG: TM2 domain-containing protein [Chlamydiia bacterium]|nr:TM2 domain-containing protein [Chlamydiia bacterium]
MVEISGITESLSGEHRLFPEEMDAKRGYAVPKGLSSTSTIQPVVNHRIDFFKNVGGGKIPFVSNKSPKSFMVTCGLMLTLFWIGAHDFYAGHTNKGISKLVFTGLAYLIHPGLLLYPFVAMIVDLVKLCNETYKDSDGKLIKA